MKLLWVQEEGSHSRFTAESFDFRYVMVAADKGWWHVAVYPVDALVKARAIRKWKFRNRVAAERAAWRWERAKGSNGG